MSTADGAPFDIFSTTRLGLTLKKKYLPAFIPPPLLEARLEGLARGSRADVGVRVGVLAYFIATVRTSRALRS